MLLLVSLHAEKPDVETFDSQPPQDVITASNTAAHAMEGYYVGPFGQKKITVRLETLIGDTIEGYSIVGGNERAFSGWYKILSSGNVDIQVKEPGNDPLDGQFHFELAATKPILTGTWTPDNKRLVAVPLVLAKRDFKYNPHAGNYPQSSVSRLKSDDVSNMTQPELRLMRNEIYARHGYSFQLPDMQRYFDLQDWYMPISTNVTGALTKTEKANETLIERYETYSADYYDRFHR